MLIYPIFADQMFANRTAIPLYTVPLKDIDKNVPLQMVAIPGDTFTMGSPEGRFDPECDETPHEITVPDFCLGRYPVTQAQWRSVAALTQVNIALKPDPSYFKGDNRPVEQVSWYEATEFCNRSGQPHTQESRT